MRVHGNTHTDRSADHHPDPDAPARLWMVYLPRVLAVVVLLALALGSVEIMVLTREKAQKRPPQGVSIVVDAIEARRHDTDRVWPGYGVARTMESADLVAEVGGRVVERPGTIEAGRAVERGELIVRLDDTDSLNALDSARQAVKSLGAQIEGLGVEEEQLRARVGFASDEIEAAKRDLDRIERAIAQGVGGAGERDVSLSALRRSQRELSALRQQLELIPSRRSRLEAELASQRASVRIAQENVDRAAIRAPLIGELQRVGPRVGDWVAAGTEVARLVDLSRLEIPLKIAASASAWVRPGDAVRLWVEEPEGEPDRLGSVTRIAPEADASSRTMTVFVELTQDAGDPDRLIPGQFVHGRVVTGDPRERVVLPRRAVQSGHVFVAGPLVDGARVIDRVAVRVAYGFEERLPELDPEETQWVALERGHEPAQGALVVVSLLDQMVAGMRVRLASDPAPGGDPPGASGGPGVEAGSGNDPHEEEAP